MDCPPALSQILYCPWFSTKAIRIPMLGNEKTAFLDDLESPSYMYIVGTGRKCIAVVQKIPKKGSTDADDPTSQYTLYKYKLNWNDLDNFVKVLFKFMTKKRPEGYELDSALTAPVLNIIEQKFIDLYEAHSQEISDKLLKALRSNDILLESFVSWLSNTLSSKILKKAQKQMVHLIAHQTHDALSSGAAHVISHRIAHFASMAVGSQVIHMTAKFLVHALAGNIGHILAKFMASAAFKKVVCALVHKMVIGIILSTVIKFLAATFGGSVGAGSLSVLLFPIIAGVIYAQAKAFPRKLGREVSKSVRDHLSLEFEGMNREILEDTFRKIFEGEELLKAVAADKDIKEMFFAVAKEFK